MMATISQCITRPGIQQIHDHGDGDGENSAMMTAAATMLAGQVRGAEVSASDDSGIMRPSGIRVSR